MWTAILAGGWGKRLGPLTSKRPKPLIRLGGKRILDYTIGQVLQVRPESGRIIVNPSMIPLEGAPPGFEVVAQKEPGLNNAIRTALEDVPEREVLLSFTGYLARPNNIAARLLDSYSESQYPVVMALAPIASGLETFGFVSVGLKGNVERVTETLEEWRAGRGYVFAGVLIGKSTVLRILYERGFMDGMNVLARRGLVGAYIWEGDWLEIAYPWDLLEAYRLVLDKYSTTIKGRAEIDSSARIGNGVVIESNAVIEENVVVKGPTFIGSRARIEANSVIGPGAVIEEGSAIGPLSIVRRSVILEKSRVGAGSVLVSSIVGENSRLPPYTVTRDGELAGIPEWMKGLVEGKPKKIVLGAVFAPYTTPDEVACKSLQPGALVK
ncbi:MAG: NDP-sugar synthase [Desulfurococcales archaeon]|nr:NDP-sugar synthase [Desulfurococcales archaeon]